MEEARLEMRVAEKSKVQEKPAPMGYNEKEDLEKKKLIAEDDSEDENLTEKKNLEDRRNKEEKENAEIAEDAEMNTIEIEVENQNIQLF